eukprot:GHRR01014973.1.p6 GENE.GHRR01014973.1~~GHRR01014973.1.p6  ORF type:complete len:118 (-),score=36.33 GHRR01014973.1:492-845(-)
MQDDSSYCEVAPQARIAPAVHMAGKCTTALRHPALAPTGGDGCWGLAGGLCSPDFAAFSPGFVFNGLRWLEMPCWQAEVNNCCCRTAAATATAATTIAAAVHTTAAAISSRAITSPA